MQHRLRSLLTSLLLITPFARSAHAAVFDRTDASTSRLVAQVLGVSARASAGAAGNAAPSGVSVLATDAGAVRAFRHAGGGTLALPLADGGTATLVLEPLDVLGPNGTLSVTDDRGRHAVKPDVSLYKGRIAGEADSWAVIAMGAAGVFGTVQHGGERWNLSPTQAVRAGDAALPLHVLAPERAREGADRFECGIDATNAERYTDPKARPVPGLLPGPDDAGGLGAPLGRNGLVAPARGTAAAQVLAATRTSWKIAVDCDYEVYHLKFADNLTAASSYVLTVLGTVSLIYERDLAATLTFPYVNLWTTVADPYSSATTGAQLTQMQGYWGANNAGIQRSAAFLMSGRNLGGGLAIIGSLCNTPSAYALAAMDFVYTYPTATSTWDVDVVSHELGHIFGSYHTQSCNWATLGYVPAATTLDSCFTSEGACATYSNHLPPNKGTIMSYCHVQFGVANGIRLEFHPVCVARMRSTMAVAACSTQMQPQPPRDPLATALPAGVRVSWTASISPNVLGYELYRSKDPLDTKPVRAGFTSTLQFDDTGIGSAFYYRVRTVRTADTSSWSPEVKGTLSCGVATGASFTTGSGPGMAVPLDLNGDGREDVAVLRRDAGVLTMMFGAGTGAVGDGTFGAPATTFAGFVPGCFALGDLSGDGIADLVTGEESDNSIRIQKGNAVAGVPNASFQSAYGLGIAPGTPRAIALADVNEDGIEDILACADGTVVKLLGRGAAGVANGNFGPYQSTPLTMTTRDLLLHDFNADGVLDLIASGDLGLRSLAGVGLAGRGDGSFAPEGSVFSGAPLGSLAVADLDLDGADDVLVLGTADTLLRVFRGLKTAGVPNGTFAAGATFGAGVNPRSLAVVDWDHSGTADIVIANNTAPGTVSVLIGRGDGTFAPRFTIAAGADSIGTVIATDYDEDGTVDVLAVSRSNGSLARLSPTCPNTLGIGVTMVTPNGGETWTVQDERTVTWTKGSGVLSVDLQFSSDGGAHWRTIARELTGTSWNWTVAGAITSTTRLRVVAHGMPQSNDASNANFTLIPFSTLGVDDRAPRLALLGAWPNPARRDLTVSFTLPTGARGTLELVDLAGRRVAERDLTGLAAGAHQLPLLEQATLAPGVYLVRLRIGGDLRLAKVSVVR